MTTFIPLSSISIGPRQRTSMDPKDFSDLVASIDTHGLLHPPVVNQRGVDSYELIAGERRLRALTILQREGKGIKFGPLLCEGDKIPVLLLQDVSPLELLEIEFDENVIRAELSWQDRVHALATIHKLRQQDNPMQTIAATARELDTKAGVTSSSASGAPRSQTAQSISKSVKVAPFLADPVVARAKSLSHAYDMVLKQENAKYEAELVRRRLKKLASTGVESSIALRHGDMMEILPRLDANTFDVIIADPPYGLAMDDKGPNPSQSTRMRDHGYQDSEEYAKQIYKMIITEGFRITKPSANMFLFCDIRHWRFLEDLCRSAGWPTWKWPIIWQKSQEEGFFPWGNKGFMRTYEMILFATKGRKGLRAPPVDVIHVKRVPRKEKVHAAEKPVELLRLLLEASSIEGDSVLDPCCGSGSTLVAARELKRRALGIEVDQSNYELAMANVYKPGATDDETRSAGAEHSGAGSDPGPLQGRDSLHPEEGRGVEHPV